PEVRVELPRCGCGREAGPGEAGEIHGGRCSLERQVRRGLTRRREREQREQKGSHAKATDHVFLIYRILLVGGGVPFPRDALSLGLPSQWEGTRRPLPASGKARRSLPPLRRYRARPRPRV